MTMNNTSSKYVNCVNPEGHFVYGIHKPAYTVVNLRKNENIEPIGVVEDASALLNAGNFPPEDITVENADWIFEIPNPLPFRGATFIDKEWADASAGNPTRIGIPRPATLSFSQLLEKKEIPADLINDLPQPLLLALATSSTDPEDLVRLATKSCEIITDDTGEASGLGYRQSARGGIRAVIHDHALFEAVANNPYLPDSFKRAMVLRPGAQGASEIVGEWPLDEQTHVFEYLRRNSYIAGGHYAANMSDDAVRYAVNTLKREDITALRHLYYQRTYVRMAEVLELPLPRKRDILPGSELEALRLQILNRLSSTECEEAATLWGWNFGFDYAPSNYRLHASHQQIHQQYAMVPENVAAHRGDMEKSIGTIAAFSSGDMIRKVIDDYDRHYGSTFFRDYLQAIANNRRMDGREDRPASLVVFEDENVLLFVPKAQTSQWELQLMTKPDAGGTFPGNILETDAQCRQSMDWAILLAQRVFEHLGARMVTTIEYSTRFSSAGNGDQPLLYSFLPKLPQSPGAFSEAQLRYINGHYPEDFAALCRTYRQG